MKKAVWVVTAVLVVAAFFVGRMEGGKSAVAGGILPVTSRPGTPVATFDGQAISVDELKAQIEEQTPFVRVRYTSPEGKKEFLEGMIRFELLAREAQKKGYQNDPDIVRQHKKNMVALFVQKEFEEAQQKQAISDDELKKYYDDHKDDYVKPERVRIQHIFLEAPKADAEKRAKRKVAADEILAEVKEKDAHDFNAFGMIARLRSEDPDSRPVSGDLHYLSRGELEKRTGKEVADAAFAMRDNGRVNDGVVETDKGFHIIKFLGRESPLDLRFEDVKDTIRTRLIYERRAENYNKFVADLEKSSGLKIDDKALEEMKVNLASPTPLTPPGLSDPTVGVPPAPTRRIEATNRPAVPEADTGH